jgi:hypothetical protein
MKHDEEHLEMTESSVRNERIERSVLDAPELDDETPAERHVAAWAETLDVAAREGLEALDADERVRFERALAEDAALREALADAQQARALFAAVVLPSAERSRELRARILAAVDADGGASSPTMVSDASHSRRVERHASRRTSAPVGRRGRRAEWLAHAVAAVAAVVLLAVVLPSQLRNGHESGSVTIDGQSYTEAEVRAATEQMEMAMTMLSHAVDRTSSIVRSEMNQELRQHVTDPLQEGFGRAVRSIPYLRPVPREDGHSGLLSPLRGPNAHGLDMTGSLERT